MVITHTPLHYFKDLQNRTSSELNKQLINTPRTKRLIIYHQERNCDHPSFGGVNKIVKEIVSFQPNYLPLTLCRRTFLNFLALQMKNEMMSGVCNESALSKIARGKLNSSVRRSMGWIVFSFPKRFKFKCMIILLVFLRR